MAVRILVVDDDPALLVALREALRLRMPQVVVDTTNAAAAAIEQVARIDYDAVVTDIKMPGMDGLTLLAELHRRAPKVPTLLITGHGQHDLAVQALRGGAFDFIQKPLDRDYIVASLSRAIQVRELRRKVDAQQQALEAHAAQLEDEVAARTRELREANQAKDEFLATLAHELRNPLASICSAAHLMARCRPDEAVRAEALETVERQGAHMKRLLDDLLDVSRITLKRINLCRERLNLGGIVQQAAEAVRPHLDECGQHLSVDLPGEALCVDGDPTRLEQIVVNLLNNAVKYTDAGGQIGLTLEREGDDALVRVRDSGIGIAREMLPRIFEPFAQADRSLDRSQGGLGIGLTLVRQLTEMHNGRVEAESDGEGRGSTFTVRFPLVEFPPVEKQPAVLRHPAAVRRRILLVDDNPTMARMMSLLLQNYGHDIVSVADGPEAIDAARAHRPEVAVLDIGLPKMDGYEVARRLRRIPELKEVVLIAMTGYGQDEDYRRSREAGFDYHVVKPVAIETLQELIVRGAAVRSPLVSALS